MANPVLRLWYRHASGDDRVIEAAKQAINSPLPDVTIEGAKGVLLNVRGGADLAMAEVAEAASIITQHVDRDANIILGAGFTEEELKKGEVKVTVIATGFATGFQPSRPGITNQAREANFFGTNEPRPRVDIARPTEQRYGRLRWQRRSFRRAIPRRRADDHRSLGC
jgi:cell division protein FtsZ